MSWGDLAGADAYHAARADEAWAAGDTAARQAALVRGQDHIRSAYASRFVAGKEAPAETLAECVYIAAGLEIVTPGFFRRAFTPDQRRTLSQVGPISWTVSEAGPDMATPRSVVIDDFLDPYVTRRGGPTSFMASVGR